MKRHALVHHKRALSTRVWTPHSFAGSTDLPAGYVAQVRAVRPLGVKKPLIMRVSDRGKGDRPNGALFQQPEDASSPLKDAWLILGLYVILGLVAGATCGYLAVGRGLSPLPWFFAGLLLNVVALAVLVIARRPADLSHYPGGIPSGLKKVPTTRAPRRCPGCGANNHPAARSCTSCRGPLNPLVEAETGHA